MENMLPCTESDSRGLPNPLKGEHSFFGALDVRTPVQIPTLESSIQQSYPKF